MTAIDSQTDLPLARESRWRWSALPLIGRAKPFHLLLTLVLYGFFAVFLIWPIVQVVISGFVRREGGRAHYTEAYVQLIFQDPALRAGMLNALLIAVLV